MAKALPWQHTAWEGMEKRTRKCMWKCIGELIGNIQGKHRVVCPPKLGVCSEVLGSSLGFRGDAGKMQGEHKVKLQQNPWIAQGKLYLTVRLI